MVLDIATGHSARSKTWTNKRVSWSSIAMKLCTPVYTTETLKEYKKASKADRARIKDTGGYVGGYLHNGKRSPANVLHRQLLTLDIDYANIDFWEDFQMIFNNAAVLHATHSHTLDNPRFRLVMPMSREATAEEYAAFSRKVAGALDIELFDNTTFQVSRLMYWPSCPKDVQYYCEQQEGPWIDVDEVLGQYEDWRDSSQWPTSAKNIHHVRDLSAKQQDPASKKNIVGLFCRTYSLTDALETFLTDEYEEAKDGRWTYKHGSTASGLVVYDDKFAYSHHGTDPTSGMLCNAFDLVRIHKFGHEDTTEVKNPLQAKSYKLMQDYILTLPKIKRTIAAEKITEATFDFSDDTEPDKYTEKAEELDLSWTEDMDVNKNGDYLSSAKNINLILSNDLWFTNAFRYNEFDNKRYVVQDMPWRKIKNPDPIKNVDYSGIRNYIETVYGVYGVQKIEDALALRFEQFSFHPVKEYLNGLEWDGQERVDTLLIDYFGVEDTLYAREAIRKTLTAAVARVFRPGIKYDLVLTLVGAQGTGKSTLISKLGNGWSSDSFLTVHGKEAFEQLQGAWLIEMAELSGLRKAEVEAVKHFISKQEDTFRPAYARSPETFPRQCVFFGTTNNANFLRDPTGNRRFVPVDVNPEQATLSIFNIEQSEIDQIWAEAVTLYQSGEKLYMSKEAEEMAQVEQANHSSDDERRGLITDYLSVKLPKNWWQWDTFQRRIFLEDTPEDGAQIRTTVCVAEIWCECLGKNKEDMDRYKTRELNDILRSLPDWRYAKGTKRIHPYGVQRYYERV